MCLEYWDGIAGGEFEEPIFENVGLPAATVGSLTPEQLIQICYWKSPRRIGLVVDWLSTQSDTQIAEVTGTALAAAEQGNDQTSVNALTEILGVDVPTASAILAVVVPQRYAVIDRFSMAALAAVDPTYQPPAGTPSARHHITEYLPRIRAVAERRGWTPRRVEKALWTRGRWANWEQGVRQFLP